MNESQDSGQTTIDNINQFLIKNNFFTNHQKYILTQQGNDSKHNSYEIYVNTKKKKLENFLKLIYIVFNKISIQKKQEEQKEQYIKKKIGEHHPDGSRAYQFTQNTNNEFYNMSSWETLLPLLIRNKEDEINTMLETSDIDKDKKIHIEKLVEKLKATQKTDLKNSSNIIYNSIYEVYFNRGKNIANSLNERYDNISKDFHRKFLDIYKFLKKIDKPDINIEEKNNIKEESDIQFINIINELKIRLLDFNNDLKSFVTIYGKNYIEESSQQTSEEATSISDSDSNTKHKIKIQEEINEIKSNKTKVDDDITKKKN